MLSVWNTSSRHHAAAPRRRHIVWIGFTALLALTLPACSYYPKLKPTWRENLTHRDPQIRLQAVLKVTEAGDPTTVPDLLRRLDDDDDAVRYYAHIGVKKLTHQDFGFLPYAARAERAKAAMRWWSWYERHGAASTAASTAPAGSATDAPPIPAPEGRKP